MEIKDKKEEQTIDLKEPQILDVTEINKRLLENSKAKEPKILDNELPKQFPETYKEEGEQKEKEWKIKMGDNIKYVDMLKDSPYSFDRRGLRFYKSEYGYEAEISNVLVIPKKQINIYDGDKKTSYIELGAILDTGEELPDITIPINEIDGCKFYTNSEWGIKIYFETSANKSIQNNCIKFLAKNMKEETIFKFTGFYKVDDKYIFLHSRRSNRNR